jgi:hypothetical protein
MPPFIAAKKGPLSRTPESGAGFTLTREAVRDLSTTFALLTALKMTAEACASNSQGLLGWQAWLAIV